MGKLVRDKIPDIIRASGRTPHVSTLAGDQYRLALIDKIREEVDELVAAEKSDAVIEEAADVLEVLIAMVAEHGADLDSIVDVARHKRTERGGFGMRVWLDRIDTIPSGP